MPESLALTQFEIRTIRKIRLRILPLVCVLYVVAFIDRINIGFAALEMNRELAITSQQYGLLAGIFFCGYVIFEVPSNLALHKFGARIWIARILVSWGIVATLTGFAQTVTQLCLARFLLGAAEAGFFPGIVLYFTYWFRQREQALAVALLFAGAPVASIVGAPISGTLLDHAHWLNLPGWRWLLILEGLPAIVCGALTLFLLPEHPAEAAFLTADERKWIESELNREKLEKAPASDVPLWRVFANRRVWHLALTVFWWDIGLYWMNFWMPQKLKSLSSLFSNTTVGMLVVIPQLAGLIGMVLVSRSSDHRQERRFHAAVPAIIGGIALLLLPAADSPILTITVLNIMAVGVYSFLAPFCSRWSEFLTGSAAAAGIALINSVGNVGAFVGPYAIGAIDQRIGGFNGGIVFTGLSLLACGTLALLLRGTGKPALSIPARGRILPNGQMDGTKVAGA